MATNLGFNSDSSKFSETETPSAPPFDDAPPNYFDISIVPNAAVLYKEQSAPIEEPSMAEIERTTKGVLSFDELIDRNPDQMWLYFMTYLNEKPRLNVKILGYYTEVILIFLVELKKQTFIHSITQLQRLDKMRMATLTQKQFNSHVL